MRIRQDKSQNLVVSDALSKSPHFWRGYFDGDGSVWTDSGRLYMELCNGTPEILQQWCQFLTSSVRGARVRKMSKNHNAFRARLGGQKAAIALQLLYPKGTTVFLSRKWTKADTILKGLLSLVADLPRRTSPQPGAESAFLMH